MRDKDLPSALLTPDPNHLDIERVLQQLATGGPGTMFAAHPDLSFYEWTDRQDQQAASLGSFKTRQNGVRGSEFVYKGLQIWNTQSLHKRQGVAGYQFRRLNPFASPKDHRVIDQVYRGGWESEADPYLELKTSLARWEALVRQGLDYRFDGEAATFLRKLYILAGTDAHGDFNYATGGLPAHFSSFNYARPLDFYSSADDNAFARLRTLVLHEGSRSRGDMDHGRAILTNGPLADFFLDAEVHFKSDTLDWFESFNQPSQANDRDGQIGGAGAFDGARTLLFEVDGQPVVKNRWANSSDFGGAIDHMALFAVHNQQTPGQAQQVQQFLSVTAFQNLFMGDILAKTNLKNENSALYLGAFTQTRNPLGQRDGRRLVNGQFFCLTNPAWVSPVTITPIVKKAKEPDGGYWDGPGTPVTFPAGALGFTIELNVSLRIGARHQPSFKQLGSTGRTSGVGRPLTSTQSQSSNGTKFTFTNASELSLLTGSGNTYPDVDHITLVFYLATPIDDFGNQLNPVAKLVPPLKLSDFRRN